MKCSLFLLSIVLLPLAMRAEVKVPNLFSDHAVLQCDQKIHIWGEGKPGEAVTVKLHEQTQSTTTDAQGRWSLFLTPEPAGGPYVLEINTLKIKDVLVGDVFLASGQSNMKYTVKGHPPTSVPVHAAEIKAGANIPTMRFLRVPQVGLDAPADDQATKWSVSSPTTMEDFSLIAYLAGKELVETKKVPVGLIESDYGGTPIQAWMSQQAYDSDPKLYPPALTAYQLFVSGDAPPEPGEAPPNADAKRIAGLSLAQRAKDSPKMQAAKNEAHKPTALFNGMIAPIVGYTLKGVMWYQGESDDSPTQAPHYAAWLSAMITDWRTKWGQGDFPFIIIQISSFNGGKLTQWGTIRDAERRTLSLPNTGLVITYDVGNPDNPHPSDKETPAKRVVLSAREIAYGEKVESFGPLVQSARLDGNVIKVSFTHAEGLMSKGGPLQGFEVAGPDGAFVPAKATIVKGDVFVSASVKNPSAVRFAFANNAMDANLVNGSGLPASTFLMNVK